MRTTTFEVVVAELLATAALSLGVTGDLPLVQSVEAVSTASQQIAQTASKAGLRASRKPKSKKNQRKRGRKHRGAKRHRSSSGRKPAGCKLPTGYLIKNGPRTGNRVALTFDESLGPETRKILHILDRYDAKATFFQVGEQVREHPELARAIVRKGHEIASHTWDHSDMRALTPKQQRSQLQRTNKVIRQATGFTPCAWRPPGGAWSDQAVKTAASIGLATIMWDTGAGEWALTVPKIIAHLDRTIDRGSIVLFHQVPSATLSLEPVLQNMGKKGLRSVTLTKLLGGKVHYRR